MLSDADFRHGLLDPEVRKRRPLVHGRGVYVRVVCLERALRDRGCTFDPRDLDEYVRSLGGERLQHGRWHARLARTKRFTRPAEFFLPELAYQRVRQRR